MCILDPHFFSERGDGLTSLEVSSLSSFLNCTCNTSFLKARAFFLPHIKILVGLFVMNLIIELPLLDNTNNKMLLKVKYE